MTKASDIARDHYQAAIVDPDALIADIERALDALGSPISAARLAGFDQFHVGALQATVELARLAGISADWRVLDAGSGLGGPSRYLAEAFGCRVSGVDIAPAYVRVAQLLAGRAGLSQLLTYQTGNIADLPFDDAEFDLVWTQHVVMNIPERDALYRELRRVLKAGGRLAFYDPYVPDHGEPLVYPTPWAESAETSTLLTQAATTRALEGAGFAVGCWNDVTDLATTWFAEQRLRIQGANPGTGGVHTLSTATVVGPRMPTMLANLAQNLAQGRVRFVMGLCAAV